MKNICCFCGKPGGTKDHIPPRSFFTAQERKSPKLNLITVRACVSCNNAASPSDEAFKLISTLCAIRLGRHTNDVVLSSRATLKVNSELKLFVQSSHDIGNGQSALLINNELKIKFDSVMSRIARALYYKEYREIMLAANLTVNMLAGFDCSNIETVFERNRAAFNFLELINPGLLNHSVVLKGVFEYWWGMAEDCPKASVFYLLFRDSLFVTCLSLPEK